MNKSLMKTVSGSEFAPVAHRITDISAGSAAGRGDNAIALDTESIRSGALMFLF